MAVVARSSSSTSCSSGASAASGLGPCDGANFHRVGSQRRRPPQGRLPTRGLFDGRAASSSAGSPSQAGGRREERPRKSGRDGGAPRTPAWQKLLDERAAALASDRAWDLDLMPNAHPPMMPQPMISTRPNSATEPVWGAPDSGSGAEAQAGGTRRSVQSARSAQSARSRPKSRAVVGAGATVGSVDGATILAMYADMMSSSKEREEAAAEAQAQEKAADTVAAEVVKGMVDGGGVVPWGETDESLRATPSYGAAGKAGGRDSAQHAADARRGSQTARPATAPASPRRQPSTVQMGLVPASAALPPQGGSSARGALEEASGRHNAAAGTAKRPRSTGVKYFAGAAATGSRRRRWRDWNSAGEKEVCAHRVGAAGSLVLVDRHVVAR